MALKNLTEEKIEELRAIIEAAYEKAGEYNPFVASCDEFLESRGFLTEKQIKALVSIEATSEEDDFMYEEIHFGQD